MGATVSADTVGGVDVTAVACSGVRFDTVVRGGVAAFDTSEANRSFPLETPAVSSVEPCDECTVEGTTDGPASALGNIPVVVTGTPANRSIAGVVEGGTAAHTPMSAGTSCFPVVDTIVDVAGCGTATVAQENKPFAVLASDDTAAAAVVWENKPLAVSASDSAETTRSGEGGADPNKSATVAVVFSCIWDGGGATMSATEAATLRTFCIMVLACWDAAWAVYKRAEEVCENRFMAVVSAGEGTSSS